MAQALAALPAITTSLTLQCRFVRKDGGLSWTEWRLAPAAQEAIAYCAARDVTDRKKFEQQLEHMAFHDPLTKLANRSLFMERLERAVATAARRQSACAVFFMDLDSFKVVNDSLGHDAGDQLLAQIAQRLTECVNDGDTVARFAGDEFTILVREVSGEEEAGAVAARIGKAFQSGFVVNERELFVSFSIGIALSTVEKMRPDTLLTRADVAMYQCKRNRLTFAVWNSTMDRITLERLELRSQLKRAVGRDELRLHYQPIVDMSTGSVVGFEALVRWMHPERGLLYPGDFLPEAEETGLIVEIDRWVLCQACRQTQQWRTAYPDHTRLFVSVNLSERHLLSPDFVEVIVDTLRETGLDPHCLQLEIVERVILREPQLVAPLLIELRELGVRLALDDFGSGYSAIQYLKQYPITVVKIDRSFTADLGRTPEDTAFVEAMVKFAAGLGLSVVVEGVERATQVAELKRLNCDMGQGYFYARPLPGEAVTKLFGGSEPLVAPTSEQLA